MFGLDVEQRLEKNKWLCDCLFQFTNLQLISYETENYILL